MNEETESFFEDYKKNLASDSGDKDDKISHKVQASNIDNVFVPAGLVLSKNIPNNAKILWGKLHYAGAVFGINIKGIVQIAKEMGIYPLAVIELLEILDKEGWLNIKFNRDADTLEYYVLTEKDETK